LVQLAGDLDLVLQLTGGDVDALGRAEVDLARVLLVATRRQGQRGGTEEQDGGEAADHAAEILDVAGDARRIEAVAAVDLAPTARNGRARAAIEVLLEDRLQSSHRPGVLALEPRVRAE